MLCELSPTKVAFDVPTFKLFFQVERVEERHLDVVRYASFFTCPLEAQYGKNKKAEL